MTCPGKKIVQDFPSGSLFNEKGRSELHKSTPPLILFVLDTRSLQLVIDTRSMQEKSPE